MAVCVADVVCDAAETVHSHTVFCDGGFIDNNGNCYQLHGSNKSWSDASEMCSSRGYHLVTIKVNKMADVICRTSCV